MNIVLNRLNQLQVRNITQNPLFWVGLAIKLVLSAFFCSDFLKELFTPFVNYYLESDFSNPYEHFFLMGMENAFPYPKFMLWILAAPRFVLGAFFTSGHFFNLDIFVYRLPILLADFVILLTLSQWLKDSVKKAIIFYWLSPVVIYINYLHGQLDVIPICLLVVSLYFLFKEKIIKASILLGLALATKTHILLAVPFYYIYLYSRGVGWRNCISSILISAGLFVLINCNYASNDYFMQMVFFNAQQALVWSASIEYVGTTVLYIIPAAYMLLLVRGITMRSYNKDLFLMFLGFSFGILLLFIPPMPGWYYWVIVFFVYFYIKQADAPIVLFVFLNIFYFIYFLTIKESDYLKIFQLVSVDIASQSALYEVLKSNGINADKVSNIAFTLLQVTLLVNCAYVYKRGVSSYSKHKITSKPYLIGISGDSGVGKTTLAQALEDIFKKRNTTIIRGDDMHKWKRGDSQWGNFTHLNPKANHLHKELNYLLALNKGQNISREIYDHSVGDFTSAKNILSKKVIIFEGLHTFYIQSMRRLYDLKIFIQLEKDLQKHWKLVRDVTKRGHSKERVLKQIEDREEDSAIYIETQIKYADIVIEFLCKNPIEDIGNPDINPEVYLKIAFPNSYYIDPLLDALATIKLLNISHSYLNEDRQMIQVEGDISAHTLCDLSYVVVPGLEEIGINSPEWNDGLLGFLQLFTCYCVMLEVSSSHDD